MLNARARAAALVLVCVLVWPLPDVLAAAVDAGASFAGVPLPIGARIAIVLAVAAARLAMMIGAIRVGERWDPPRQTMWIVLAVAALVGLVATIGTTMLHAAAPMLLGRSDGVAQLAAYAKDGAIVGVVGVVVSVFVVIGAAAYAVSRSVRPET